MNDRELRLECIKLAQSRDTHISHVIDVAEKFYNWIVIRSGAADCCEGLSQLKGNQHTSEVSTVE
jgi:hypothetical protein